MAQFPELGFQHVPDCFRITLRPGETGSREVRIKSSPISCDGPKPFQEVAVNESAPGFLGLANAVFNVTALIPDCGNPNGANQEIKAADQQLKARVATVMSTVAGSAGISLQADKVVYETDSAAIVATAPLAGVENLTLEDLRRGANLEFILLCSLQDTFSLPSGSPIPNGFYIIKGFAIPDTTVLQLQVVDLTGNVVAGSLEEFDFGARGGKRRGKYKCRFKIPCSDSPIGICVDCTVEGTFLIPF
jgi:hypothetical protein